MSNAARYRKKAAEFEGLKQIDRAIAMYATAIQESEKGGEEVDVALLNKVGDLTLRQGRIADAVVYYERAVEHYATAGLFNNAIALCNKILRSAPGRSNVYYTLGRICARKGLRGDATRNFLEYASRMRQDGRVEEGMRALAEVADLMPELTEVRRLVEEHAERNGIALPARRTPSSVAAQGEGTPSTAPSPGSLVFLDIDYDGDKGAGANAAPAPGGRPHSASLDDVMLFDPSTADGDVEMEGFLSSADLGIREPEVVEDDVQAARRQSLTDPSLTWLVPPSDEEQASAPEGLEPDEFSTAGAEGVSAISPLDGLTSQGTEEPAVGSALDGLEPTHDASGFEISDGPSGSDAPGAPEPLETTEKETPLPVSALEGVEPVPELEAAIAAGSEAVARGQGLPLPARPVFRLAPHEFVQTGELPPLLLTDSLPGRIAPPAPPIPPTPSAAAAATPPAGSPALAFRSTPAVPIAAVAAEANAVASSRRDSLRAAVAAEPRDWRLRRRLAEALFEAGERDAALAELETALNGFAEENDIAAAADIADELVRVCGDQVPYHQRRVEMSVRLHDNGRLQVAYLDLADALVQGGDEGRARAVYARVLEMDPWDDRARSALGTAAPPPPGAAPPERPDDRFVDLASWLDDDAESPTRMRMREPVASGDEQADFDALLRHFKEGVSRSLGEEDYESHYDLGVAYKEMGLLDDAIAEFQKALRSRSHRLPAYEALGQCFVEQERYQVAATVLSRALHEPGLTDEQRIGVLYLLALSSEALERWPEARSYYQRVYATDIHFRDVAARLAVIDQVAR